MSGLSQINKETTTSSEEWTPGGRWKLLFKIVKLYLLIRFGNELIKSPDGSQTNLKTEGGREGDEYTKVLTGAFW